MMIDAERRMGGIDFTTSWTIGDKLLDMEMGQSVGTKTGLLQSKYWANTDIVNRTKQPDMIAESLYEAAKWILKARQ